MSAEDLKGQRVGLTDDGSGGEQDTPEKLVGSKSDKPLRDSALPCIIITALLATFGMVAVITGGILVAAFGSRPSSELPLHLAMNNQTTGRVLSSSSEWVWKAGLENGAYHVRGYDANGVAVTWANALDSLAVGRLGPALTEQLRLSPHAGGAFFWELPPLTLASAASIPFEFVTMDAPGLASARTDSQPFAHHLASCVGSLSSQAFANLGGDAVLVSPCNAAKVPKAAYASLAHFLRGAPAEQRNKLWVMLGVTLRSTLRERGARPTWVSTEGSGVSWLHGEPSLESVLAFWTCLLTWSIVNCDVADSYRSNPATAVRLDSSPKYFHFLEYRQAPLD